MNAGGTFVAKCEEVMVKDSVTLAEALKNMGFTKKRLGIRIYDIACRWRDHGPGRTSYSGHEEKRCIGDMNSLLEHHGDKVPPAAADLVNEIMKERPRPEAAVVPSIRINDHAFERYAMRVSAKTERNEVIKAIVHAVEQGREVRLVDGIEQARKIARFGETRYFHNTGKGFVAVVAKENGEPVVVSIYFYVPKRWKTI